ncbi:hypothetical protein [Duganella violaceipulchra]|uniref:Uncharacterized protein n=1 Tax=Duganella violaceipulchra TaxID=2849652 RepID=A0AA41H922_9BURK|nr:hypothetical protein [Duganella violaceicalia]MBV6321785.1 hypothetical protein [Duganella violaceicalia]MCP2007221.1 hypothetical protein [Duganella violaceicalia]
MKVLEAMALENFIGRLRAQLAGLEERADSAAATGVVEGDALLQEVRAGVALAQSFHLETERDVAALVTTLKNHFGSCAPDLPRPALSILTTWGVEPQDKLRRFAELAGGPPRMVADGQ